MKQIILAETVLQQKMLLGMIYFHLTFYNFQSSVQSSFISGSSIKLQFNPVLKISVEKKTSQAICQREGDDDIKSWKTDIKNLNRILAQTYHKNQNTVSPMLPYVWLTK